MLKTILNLGKTLNKFEQESIFGGKRCDIQCTWRLDPIACRCISYGEDTSA